jgi:predicted nucleotidyltransferase
MTSTMRIEKDFNEFLKLLNKNEVKYLIIGGFAYSFYAKPRYTKDLDIFVERSEENAAKIMTAIIEFWGESAGLKKADFLQKGTFIQMGYPPLRIDVTTHCEGLDFAAAWENRIRAKYGVVDVYFISLPDLIKNKTACGRDQDLVDVKYLKKVEEATSLYRRS